MFESMKGSFLSVLAQLGIMYIFIIFGYALKKKNVVKDFSVLSILEYYVFCPVLAFTTQAEKFTVENLSTNLTLAVSGAVMTGLAIVLSFPLSRMLTKNEVERRVAQYTCMIPNTGYVGTPLLLALFPELYAFYGVLGLVNGIVCYTYGVILLEGNGRKFSPKMLLNIPLLATVAGMIYGITGLPLPKVVVDFGTTAGNCIGPVAMLIAGMVLARRPMKENLTYPKSYILSIMRLIIIPVIIGGITFVCCYFLGLDSMVMLLVMLFVAMPIGLNPVIFLEKNGVDSKFGAQNAFISMAISLITIPLMIALTQYLITLL